MLSVETFRVGAGKIWIGVFWEKKIQGITFSTERGPFEAGLKRLESFLKKRKVEIDATPEGSDYPELVREVMLGRVGNTEALAVLSFEGVTPFEKRVYEWLTKNVKRGSVITYGGLARRLKTSPRAVGGAMKRNPYPIVVPCHRVVSANGIGYYTPRLDEKVFLLKIEGVKGWTNLRRI